MFGDFAVNVSHETAADHAPSPPTLEQPPRRRELKNNKTINCKYIELHRVITSCTIRCS